MSWLIGGAITVILLVGTYRAIHRSNSKQDKKPDDGSSAYGEGGYNADDRDNSDVSSSDSGSDGGSADGGGGGSD